jgi:hypothetical protein
MNRFPYLVFFSSTLFALGLSASACSTPTVESAALPADAGGVGEGGSFFDGFSHSDAGIVPTEAAPPSPCGPGNVSGFVPSYEQPVGPYTGDCTMDQLNHLIADCFTVGGKDCTAWLANPKNNACISCWAGPITASSWAPVVYSLNGGEANFINAGGCVALADPGQLECAQETEFDLECDLAACVEQCPIPKTGDTQSAGTALDECISAADKAGCATYAAARLACETKIGSDPTPAAAAFCYSANSNPTDLLKYFVLACGPAPAGTDAGPAPDAGTGSGSDGGSEPPDASSTPH